MHQQRVHYLVPILFVALLAPVVTTVLSAATRVETTCQVPLDYSSIQSAVNESTCKVIQLSAGTFAGNVVVDRAVTVQGKGMGATVVSGPATGTVFKIESNGVVTLTHMAIINGRTGIDNSGRLLLKQSVVRDNDGKGKLSGGGIINGGTLTMTMSQVSDNRGGLGAGVYTGNWIGDSSLLIVDSMLNNNQNTYGGGGLYVSSGNAIVMRSILNGNTADTGGGIFVDWGFLTVLDSTISNNIAANAGGGIHSTGNCNLTNTTFSGNAAMMRYGGLSNSGYRGEPWGRMRLTNVTVTGNSAPEGGGIANSGLLTMTNSIVANSVAGVDCLNQDSFEDGGHNLVEDGSCITEASSLSGDPKLLSLGDYGGPTPTSALFLTSLAIDAGTDAACPATDQRGVERPVDGDNNGQAHCDIGAFEYDGPSPPAYYVHVPLIERR